MKGYLYGWGLLAGAFVAGMVVLAVVGFFCIRFGESGARKLLAACSATAEHGLIIRIDSSPPQWLSPRDTVRRKYVAPKPKG